MMLVVVLLVSFKEIELYPVNGQLDVIHQLVDDELQATSRQPSAGFYRVPPTATNQSAVHSGEMLAQDTFVKKVQDMIKNLTKQQDSGENISKVNMVKTKSFLRPTAIPPIEKFFVTASPTSRIQPIGNRLYGFVEPSSIPPISDQMIEIGKIPPIADLPSRNVIGSVKGKDFKRLLLKRTTRYLRGQIFRFSAKRVFIPPPPPIKLESLKPLLELEPFQKTKDIENIKQQVVKIKKVPEVDPIQNHLEQTE
ncbi:uncharacterized protein LOC116603611 [Nematostella vectensis]|uniref:uncharacterized protein LOC116603611 n=1 Tax=Nematostella vectensis TaxID=45351 RepID=UPI002077477A|nr:uncharacterized protein LOC116603611 [Nematostella vectensis]